MVDHRATWVRLRNAAQERFLNDDFADEIAVREAFDAEETAPYAADLNAQVEARGVLDLGATLWEPDLNVKRGPDGAPKTAQPTPLPATNLGASVEMP
jgi:hypothetical protein